MAYYLAPVWSVKKRFDEIFAILIDKFYITHMISNPIPYIVFYCTDKFLQYLIAMYVLLFENSNQQGISNLCLHVTLWKTYEISFHIVQNTYIFPLYKYYLKFSSS